ncbi:MAG: class I SAM-dependent rRNA methyltransferase [Spirochaetia bacterium]|nr:class I SAM-dependent rRNA methyltransferase [Spirochaetia bacterium]
MATIILKSKEDIRIRRGHPWIYDNEIARVEGEPEPGGEVEVRDARGLHVGYAFFNPNSKIRARVYSRTAKKADEEFFVRAFEAAWKWRKFCFGEPAIERRLSLRLVYGEADSVPGLIVDGFVGATGTEGLWLSVQFLSLGVEMRKAEILKALRSVFNPDGIAERSDAPVRALEGLPESVGVLWGSVPERIVIEENGALFEIDLLGGQKTGWFLDQRANRAAAAKYVSRAQWADSPNKAIGARVLDMFCNQGGFSVLAAKAGAASVLAVDSSRDALALLRKNAALNSVSDRITIVEANAFDYLRDLEKMGQRFDLIILDPPAFAKNRAALEGARRGYKELNLRAMHLLERGGVLVTFSCSHWFSPEMFDAVLADAAFDSNRRLHILEERTQDLDHPILSGYDESRYLKCRIVQVV